MVRITIEYNEKTLGQFRGHEIVGEVWLVQDLQAKLSDIILDNGARVRMSDTDTSDEAENHVIDFVDRLDSLRDCR